MIQELLGGGVGIGGGSEERKISINGGAVEGSSSSSSSSENQNLRCPRCDSSNTKFCYYNNYNLTQPRHFCKTCRRYWTKGGALRNVPIGGGCRKNKTASVATATGKSNAAAKAKPILSSENNLVVTGKPSLGNGLDREHLPNPMLWATQQNSQLLALLKAAQNPNPRTGPVMVKEERVAIGSHMGSDSTVMASVLNARNMGLDTLTQAPFGLSNSFWRSNQNQQQQLLQHNPQQQHNMLLGEVPNTGIQELYQRMRSASNYYNDHSPIAMNNLSSSSSSLSSSSSAAASSVLEPASIAGGQLGYWNPAFSWSDLPSTNGAFP